MTTASVPWLTGTAINPLLRAAHLSRSRADGAVTVFLPWIEPSAQTQIFPKGVVFATRCEQAAYVLKWLADIGGEPEAAKRLRVAFYDAHYHATQGSVYSMGETLEMMESQQLERFGWATCDVGAWTPDVVVLEEPEHLNWYAYRDGDRSSWRGRFGHVVGIVHTNYVRYAATERACGGLLGEAVHPVVGPFKGGMAFLMARWMCAAHCHRVVKLSGTLPKLTHSGAECVSNVHGVRTRFLEIGDDKATSSPFRSADGELPLVVRNPFAEPAVPLTSGAYFIGKMLWQKGLDRLVVLLASTRDEFGGSLPSARPFEVVGDGLNRAEVERAFKAKGLRAIFHGRRDHTDALCRGYRVLVNPSLTEVLCTTTAEALAMGKWVVVARDPSNEFFYQFPTCLPFTTPHEFAVAYAFALRHEPPPLSRVLRERLTWAAATRRFCDAAAVPRASTPVGRPQMLAAWLHTRMGRGLGGDTMRSVAGAGLKVGRQAAYVAAKRKLAPA